MMKKILLFALLLFVFLVHEVDGQNINLHNDMTNNTYSTIRTNGQGIGGILTPKNSNGYGQAGDLVYYAFGNRDLNFRASNGDINFFPDGETQQFRFNNIGQLFSEGNIYVGNRSSKRLFATHISGKNNSSLAAGILYINWNTGKNVFVGGNDVTDERLSDLIVNGKIETLSGITLNGETITSWDEISGSSNGSWNHIASQTIALGDYKINKTGHYLENGLKFLNEYGTAQLLSTVNVKSSLVVGTGVVKYGVGGEYDHGLTFRNIPQSTVLDENYDFSTAKKSFAIDEGKIKIYKQDLDENYGGGFDSDYDFVETGLKELPSGERRYYMSFVPEGNQDNKLEFFEFDEDSANVRIGTGELNNVVSAGTFIICDTQNTECWPDYVFDDEYDLMNLDDLQNFIQKNGHLPNVVSAEEMAKTGELDVSAVTRSLLEKIEELVLYTIEQEEQLEILSGSIEDIYNKLDELKK